MQEEIKKSYNPFKMWGSWVGFGLGVLTFPLWETEQLFLLNPISWIIPFVGDFFSNGLPFYILALFTMPVVLFIYGWGVNSFFRKINRENKVVVLLVMLILIMCPIVYTKTKEKQRFMLALSTADYDIQNAKAPPVDRVQTAEGGAREVVAMNAIDVISKHESNIEILTNKMISIANDESIAVDVRLTALGVLAIKINKMSLSEKKILSEQLALLGNQVKHSDFLLEMNKQRMNSMIIPLQKILETK